MFDELVDHGALALMCDTERLDTRKRVRGVKPSKDLLQQISCLSADGHSCFPLSCHRAS
jgi:hypothetical protein